jgi:hypothetical protein
MVWFYRVCRLESRLTKWWLGSLTQASEGNQRRLGAANGVDSLLQAVAMYKGREPASGDEEEMVANLFDAMCWVVMLAENKERFVAAEGIELMLLVIKVGHGTRPPLTPHLHTVTSSV